jgi:hypothetical protein
MRDGTIYSSTSSNESTELHRSLTEIFCSLTEFLASLAHFCKYRAPDSPEDNTGMRGSSEFPGFSVDVLQEAQVL